MVSKRKKNLWINLLKLLAVAYLIFGGDYNLYQFLKQNYQIRSLNLEIKQQQETTVGLRDELRRLKTDREYLEKIAREQYRMAKDGEKIFLIQP